MDLDMALGGGGNGTCPGAHVAGCPYVVSEDTYLANERTFLAWMRTAMAFLGFGLVIAKVFIVRVPFIFKRCVDSLTAIDPTTATTASAYVSASRTSEAA